MHVEVQREDQGGIRVKADSVVGVCFWSSSSVIFGLCLDSSPFLSPYSPSSIEES